MASGIDSNRAATNYDEETMSPDDYDKRYGAYIKKGKASCNTPEYGTMKRGYQWKCVCGIRHKYGWVLSSRYGECSWHPFRRDMFKYHDKRMAVIDALVGKG